MRRSPGAQDSRIFLALVGRLWAGCSATQFLRNRTRASRGFLFVPERTNSGSRSRACPVGQASDHRTKPLKAHAQLAAGLGRQFAESSYRLRYETARTPTGRAAKKGPTSNEAAQVVGRNAPVGHASLLSRTGSSDNRDRGESHDSSPPTPPYIRVRIRRFDRLSTVGVSRRAGESDSGVRRNGFGPCERRIRASPFLIAAQASDLDIRPHGQFEVSTSKRPSIVQAFSETRSAYYAFC